MSSIVAMRDEIKEYIQLLESTGCELSEKDKKVLDEFFERSSGRVIESLLVRLSSILKDDKRQLDFGKGFVPKKKFKISSPAVKFPNSFHEHEVLYYLEGKYVEKFSEYGFDEIGISNPRIVSSLSTIGDDLYLQYTSQDRDKFFKDSSFTYGLEVDVDLRQLKKNKQLIKTTEPMGVTH